MEKQVKYIYESPDRGKIVYRRPFGKLQPKELVILNKPIHDN